LLGKNTSKTPPLAQRISLPTLEDAPGSAAPQRWVIPMLRHADEFM